MRSQQRSRRVCPGSFGDHYKARAPSSSTGRKQTEIEQLHGNEAMANQTAIRWTTFTSMDLLLEPQEAQSPKTRQKEADHCGGVISTLVQSRMPLVIKSLDIGCCVEKWTWDYLSNACGKKLVKVHVCSSPQMDFLGKNFAYKTMTFEEFIQRIASAEQVSPYFSKDEKYYLRSIGDNPRKDVADVRKEFPELSADVKFPKLFDEDSFFSSVFRISSRNAQLWTHYDVMDNLLMVVSGVKRVVLYSPKDALYLYLKGDKSEVLDIDNPDLERFPDFQKAVPYETILHPGDVLFIPALWFHNVINVESGVAVNVFWRHLDAKQYDSNDTYGNKDLVVAGRAGQVLDRALKLLDTLPDDYRDFYARQMIIKIRTKLSSESAAIG